MPLALWITRKMAKGPRQPASLGSDCQRHPGKASIRGHENKHIKKQNKIKKFGFHQMHAGG
jgi:hypothetical protein